MAELNLENENLYELLGINISASTSEVRKTRNHSIHVSTYLQNVSFLFSIYRLKKRTGRKH